MPRREQGGGGGWGLHFFHRGSSSSAPEWPSLVLYPDNNSLKPISHSKVVAVALNVIPLFLFYGPCKLVLILLLIKMFLSCGVCGLRKRDSKPSSGGRECWNRAGKLGTEVEGESHRHDVGRLRHQTILSGAVNNSRLIARADRRGLCCSLLESCSLQRIPLSGSDAAILTCITTPRHLEPWPLSLNLMCLSNHAFASHDVSQPPRGLCLIMLEATNEVYFLYSTVSTS